MVTNRSYLFPHKIVFNKRKMIIDKIELEGLHLSKNVLI